LEKNPYFGRIVDAHCHIFPQKIAHKATVSIGAFYDIAMEAEGSAEALVESSRAIGTAKFLVCSTATRPEQVAAINDFIVAECEKNPAFIGFGTLHQDFADNLAEIDRMREMGLTGVKLHPDFQLFNIDDERMIPVYRRLAEYRMPVLFHTGDNRYDYSAPERLRRVADKVDGFVAIAAHFGGYRRWGQARDTLKDCPEIYFDTSSSLPFIDHEEAMQTIALMGSDRFFFGTDFPMWTPEEELARFLALPLDEKTQEEILCKNFLRMLERCGQKG